MQNKYEHHLNIKQNTLYPFITNHICTTCKHYSKTNWHRNLEILFIVDGSGFVRCGVNLHSVEKNDIVVVNSEVIHQIYSDHPLEYIYFIIDESFCRENGIELDKFWFQEKISCSATAEAFKQMSPSINASNNATPLAAAKMRCNILNFLIMLCEKHTTICNTADMPNLKTESHIKTVLHYIAENFNRHLTLEEIAAAGGINKHYLERVFKKHTGNTVFTHINHLRCKNAEALLLNGMSVTESALESGFESPSYFCRIYKKMYGFPPSKAKNVQS